MYLATHAILELGDKLDETTSLAVWGSHGPTVLRFEENMMPGLSALAAPVFSNRGDTIVAIAAMGAIKDFDACRSGATAKHIRSIATSQLGYSTARLSWYGGTATA